jgi:hypothetical protein
LNEAGSTFWTDTDIAAALNEGYAELADATEFYEYWTMIPMLDGLTYYNLPEIIPGTFLSPRRPQNVETNVWLKPTDARDMDYHTYVQWERTRGTPEMYLMRGHWWLGVFPRETHDTRGIRLYHTNIPADMTEDWEEPRFPREFHEGILCYAMSDLLAQERETKKAAIVWWKQYLVHEAKLKDFVDDRIRYARMDVL